MRKGPQSVNPSPKLAPDHLIGVSSSPRDCSLFMIQNTGLFATAPKAESRINNLDIFFYQMAP
jgi:hypothetical protein